MEILCSKSVGLHVSFGMQAHSILVLEFVPHTLQARSLAK